MRFQNIILGFVLISLIAAGPHSGNTSKHPRAKAKTVTITGKVSGQHGTVIFMTKTGKSSSASLSSNGSFSIKRIKISDLKNATIQFADSTGHYYGPLVLGTKAGTKAYLHFSGKYPQDESNASGIKIPLGNIVLASGAGKTKKALNKIYYSTKSVTTAVAGVPVGAAKSGFVETSAGSVRALAEASNGGEDLDSDGLPNSLDVDDDGDQVLDLADPDSAASTASENPFTTLYLGMAETLNVNVNSVTRDDIDAAIAGNGTFQLILFFSQAPDSAVTAGHVVCDPSLVYCRKTADGGSTGFYSGVSESDPSVQNQFWSSFNADGSGQPNLEYISGRQSLVAGVQPRVGTSEFRPGDLFRVELENSGGTVIDSKTLTLPPYFVTIPAVKSYDAGAGVLDVNYSNPIGTSTGNPIVLGGAGTLQINMWRPQRLSIPGAESGDYKDMGHLHYGVIIGNLPQEYTCAGYYSGRSAELSEESGLGAGGSPLASDGAVLWPLTDTSDDADPSPSSLLTFTVDLKSCLARAGGAPGAYMVTLTAAGENLSGGANRAAQNIFVQIP